jgi:hypothetical protein
MFSSLPTSRLAFTFSLLLAAALPAVVEAGWMGFRNDTQTTLIIQETAPAGKSGKPQKLYTNETIRDMQSGAGGQRTFTIADAAHPDKPLYTGVFTCPATNENVLFVLKVDGKGGVVIEAVRTPTAVTKAPQKK